MSLAGRSWDLGIRLGRAEEERKKAMRDGVCLLQERETHQGSGGIRERKQILLPHDGKKAFWGSFVRTSALKRKSVN